MLSTLPTILTATVIQHSVLNCALNSYFVLNRHHYSVPARYVGKRLELIYDDDAISVYYNMRLVTSHRRDDAPYEYSTKASHKLPGHHPNYDLEIEELLQKAADIDLEVYEYLYDVAEERKYPPQAYRTLRGMLALLPQNHKDMNAGSIDLMNKMRLFGMAEAFRTSLGSTLAENMTPDAFLSMLLGSEWDYRYTQMVNRLTKQAGFRYNAFMEDIDYDTPRNLNRNQLERLATLEFVRTGQNVFITGPTGTGKSTIAEALAHRACENGMRTYYASAPKSREPRQRAHTMQT